MTWQRHIPVALTVIRLMLGPVMLWNSWTLRSGPLFLLCLVVALLSDIFDGILARRLGVATATLRRFDSITDVVFYVAALVCIWIVYPEVVRRHAVAIAMLGSLEVVGQTISWLRFHRAAAAHAYSSKVWGIFLFLAICGVFGFGMDGVLFEVMLVVGFVAYAEWLTILALSKMAPVDVPNVLAVVERRSTRLAGETAKRGHRKIVLPLFGSGR